MGHFFMIVCLFPFQEIATGQNEHFELRARDGSETADDTLGKDRKSCSQHMKS